MSQTNIKDTYFLEDCINKKRSVQDIYEALGLYSETADTRKEPVFVVQEANDLHKKIKEYAEDTKAAYRGKRERLLTDLVKEGMFDNEVKELGEQYGQVLWSRSKKTWPSMYGRQYVESQGEILDELNWDRVPDQDTIRYILRCWITRYAVQTLASRTPQPGKGKARATTTSVRDTSDSDQSDLEHPDAAQASAGAAQPTLPFRAPEAPGKRPTENLHPENDTRHTRHGSETVLDIALNSGARSPVTPNKRKALSFQGQLSSGKLQKVIKEGRAATGSPQARRGNIYDFFSPPPPKLAVGFPRLPGRSHRENTCDTDRTYEPDAEVDLDGVMADTQETQSDVQIASDGETEPDVRSPTVGPSNAYQNHQTQDSVIPPSTQQGANGGSDTQASHQDASFQSNGELWRSAPVPTLHLDMSKLDHWQEKQLRLELCKLLLCYLNYLNQFSPDTYEPEAEERMNNLLYQFWTNDADSLVAKLGDRVPVLQAALERWMNMRAFLSKFQQTSGYYGRPGDDWKAHLKRMERVVDRAKANIAFVELKSFANTVGAAGVDKETFNEDLMTAFDCLTQVEGSNGVEAFEALRQFNQGLLEWFSL